MLRFENICITSIVCSYLTDHTYLVSPVQWSVNPAKLMQADGPRGMLGGIRETCYDCHYKQQARTLRKQKLWRSIVADLKDRLSTFIYFRLFPWTDCIGPTLIRINPIWRFLLKNENVCSVFPRRVNKSYSKSLNMCGHIADQIM